MTSAGQTVGLAVGTDQLALNAKCGGLQGDKIDVFEHVAVQGLAKHCLRIPRFF